jgi:prevent-host-death family protein
MKPIDLERGVVPISKAASSLAALIKRARADQQAIIITQKGYPSGVLLGIELFTELQALAERHQPAEEGSTESDQ